MINNPHIIDVQYTMSNSWGLSMYHRQMGHQSISARHLLHLHRLQAKHAQLRQCVGLERVRFALLSVQVCPAQARRINVAETHTIHTGMHPKHGYGENDGRWLEGFPSASGTCYGLPFSLRLVSKTISPGFQPTDCNRSLTLVSEKL